MAATAVPAMIKTSVGICGIQLTPLLTFVCCVILPFTSPLAPLPSGEGKRGRAAFFRAIGQLVKSTDVDQAVFIAGNDNFGFARECLAIFAARTAGLPGSFLGEDNLAGATFADSAGDT